MKVRREEEGHLGILTELCGDIRYSLFQVPTDPTWSIRIVKFNSFIDLEPIELQTLEHVLTIMTEVNELLPSVPVTVSKRCDFSHLTFASYLNYSEIVKLFLYVLNKGNLIFNTRLDFIWMEESIIINMLCDWFLTN